MKLRLWNVARLRVKIWELFAWTARWKILKTVGLRVIIEIIYLHFSIPEKITNSGARKTTEICAPCRHDRQAGNKQAGRRQEGGQQIGRREGEVWKWKCLSLRPRWLARPGLLPRPSLGARKLADRWATFINHLGLHLCESLPPANRHYISHLYSEWSTCIPRHDSATLLTLTNQLSQKASVEMVQNTIFMNYSAHPPPHLRPKTRGGGGEGWGGRLEEENEGGGTSLLRQFTSGVCSEAWWLVGCRWVDFKGERKKRERHQNMNWIRQWQTTQIKRLELKWCKKKCLLYVLLLDEDLKSANEGKM